MSGSRTLLTIEEAAEHIRMSARYVRRLVADGRIAHHRLGRSVRLDPVDLDAFVAAGRVEPGCDEAPAAATARASF